MRSSLTEHPSAYNNNISQVTLMHFRLVQGLEKMSFEEFYETGFRLLVSDGGRESVPEFGDKVLKGAAAASCAVDFRYSQEP